jgi:cobalt-zinc-cadmium resistance protein czcD
VKVILGLYVKRKGQQLKSDALIASGADALFDSIITLATLISAGIMLIWQVNVDGIFGTLISLVIIKAGIEMLGSPISQLLGKGVPREIYETLRSNVLDYPEVYGVFDIILNYYGPNVIIGSLHINVLDTMTSRDIHRLTRTITLDMLNKNGIIVTIGIYAINTHGEQAEIQKKVMSAVSGMENVGSLHAFYYYEDKKLVTLDVVPHSYVHDDNAFREMIQKELKALYPNFEFDIIIDHNYLEKEDK